MRCCIARCCGEAMSLLKTEMTASETCTAGSMETGKLRRARQSLFENALHFASVKNRICIYRRLEMLHRYKIIAVNGNNYMKFANEDDLEDFRRCNMQTHGHLLICCVDGFFNALCMNKKHGGAH